MQARRRPVPTRWVAHLFGGLVLLGVCAVLFPPLGLVWRAYIPFMALLILVDLWARPAPGSVTAERRLQGPYHVGRKGTYSLRLTNRTEGALEVQLKDVLPPAFEPREVLRRLTLAGGETADLEVEILCIERGPFRIPPATIRLLRPFGLLAYGEAVGEEETILVQPGRPSGETEALLARAHLLDRVGDRPVRMRGQDREFESMREFVGGDDLRFVDWKASARRFRPMIRQYQMERNAEIILALDCGRLMGSLVHGIRKLDLVMTPLLDLAAVALKRQDRVGLLAFDSRLRAYLPPRGGLLQLRRLTEALGGLPSGGVETSYTKALLHLDSRQRKRSLVILFTDFTDEISAREIHAVLAALSRRHAVLFVVVSDPHLRGIFERAPESERAVYQQAVAAELLMERRRVRVQATRTGAFALEAEPSKLSGPLIARYVEIRSRVAI